VIAAELDISTKTVEFHRARMMEKMGAESVAELVQLTLGFSLGPASKEI
jgi:FixJ family two-component response regulator